MSSFFNLDSMQQLSTTSEASSVQQQTPEDRVQSVDRNGNFDTTNLDMTLQNEIIAENNVKTTESDHVENVPTPSWIKDSTTPVDINRENFNNNNNNNNMADMHENDGNSPSPNMESSTATSDMIPKIDGLIDQSETVGGSAIVTISPPTLPFPPNVMEETEQTSDTIESSTLPHLGVATENEPVILVTVNDGEEPVNHVHHDRVESINTTASEPIMVVEADEDTSHSATNYDSMVSPSAALIIATTSTTATKNNDDVTDRAAATTTTNHGDIVIDPTTTPEQEDPDTNDDDPSEASTATTAPHPANFYVPPSKRSDVTPVETILEQVAVPVVVVADHDKADTIHHNNIPMLSPMTPSPNMTKQRPTKKLLLLISTNSIDRQVKVRQDLVQTALTAAHIEYDIIDGSVHDNESNKTLRNELFALSGLRGVYPQFFIVNLIPQNDHSTDETGTTFWGTFEQFQHVNDDGKLQEVFGCYSFNTSIESPATNNIPRNLYPSETLPPVGDISNGNEDATKEKLAKATVPDDIYEKFSQQIQRIEENYQLERKETEQRYMQQLQHHQQLYQQCEKEKKETEERFSNEIRQKDDQLQEMYRRNEGYRLKLDVLKREVSGTQELVHGRDQDLQKANQKYLNDLRAMEKQFNNAEKSAIKFQEETQIIQTKLDKTEAELLSSKQEYDTIKERAKDIAAELKHRRTECRQLQDSVAELTEQNNHLKSTVHSLEERLNHQGLNQSDKDKEIEVLRAKLAEATQETKTIENIWQEKLTKSENILTEYKKRAQHSLSMSNSRTAAAVQAREEAELDARAARSTADAALERSVKAELESREAIAKANLTVRTMENERDEAIRRLDQIKDELMAVETIRAEKERDLESVLATLKKKDIDIERLRESMNEADAKIASTQQKIMDSTNTIDDLREEVIALREELQRSATASASTVSVQNVEDGNRGIKYTPSPILLNGSQDEAENDDTLAVLRMELREANDAIEDLKSALKNAIEMNEQQQRIASAPGDNSTIPDNSDRSEMGHANSTDSGTIPLFYAMEKQAELKTARTEMNRLASLLADVQSEKMEAYDAMEEMRRRLEEAESRLKRNEKLGVNPGISNSTNEATQNDSSNASAVNIEYLKHILLRFMNAKTQTERKTLVPVIGAVLELTPDEVQAATLNIERNSASIVASNGKSLFGFLS